MERVLFFVYGCAGSGMMVLCYQIMYFDNLIMMIIILQCRMGEALRQKAYGLPVSSRPSGKEGIMEQLTLTYESGETSWYKINKNRKWTPYGMCVEYADYYEIAMYSWYMRIDKKTLQAVSNIKDVDKYVPYTGLTITAE